MWSSIQVLPNQLSKKSFYTCEDIDLRESRAKVHKKPSETLGADSILRLLTHVGFLRQNGLILSEVFCIWKEARIKKKKYVITVQKNFTFLRRFDRKNTVLGISRNLIDKFVFK